MTESKIRWMIRRDMPEVLHIGGESFEFPWSEDDFVKCLRQRNAIGMVAECGEMVVGFMIYELHRTRLELLNFAVRPDYRRRGVGAAMVAKLKSKLHPSKRTEIGLLIRETNLAGQFFFRSMGFEATGIVRDYFPQHETDEDAYRMRYSVVERVNKKAVTR